MTYLIGADPTIFPNIQRFYEQQRSDILEVKNYVQSHCTLGDAFGVLLSGLKPQYEQGRDSATTAMQTIADMLDGLGTQAEGCQKDYEDNEAALLKKIAELEAQLEAITSPTGTTTPGGYGGNVSPGGGGGGYTGGSFDVTPPAPTTSATEGIGVTVGDGGIVNIINGDGNENSVITGDNAVVGDGNATGDIAGDGNAVSGNAEATTPSTGNAPTTDAPTTDAPTTDASTTDASTGAPIGTGGAGGSGGSEGVEVPGASEAPDAFGSTGGAGTLPAVDPQVVAAENARQSALYDKLWDDQAAADPLGRTADELRLAWESRESIQLDPEAGGVTSLGYGAGGDDLLQPVPVNFQIIPTDLASSSSVNSSTLIGATR